LRQRKHQSFFPGSATSLNKSMSTMRDDAPWKIGFRVQDADRGPQ